VREIDHPTFHLALAVGELELVEAYLPIISQDPLIWDCCSQIGNPVILAIESENLEVVKAIENFVSFEPKMCCLSFPLHSAAKLPNRNIFDYIEAKVAQKDSLDMNGQTPQQIWFNKVFNS